MKPRIRTAPPRVAALAIAAGVAAFAAPRRGQRRGDVDLRQRHADRHSDDAGDNITLGVNAPA